MEPAGFFGLKPKGDQRKSAPVHVQTQANNQCGNMTWEHANVRSRLLIQKSCPCSWVAAQAALGGLEGLPELPLSRDRRLNPQANILQFRCSQVRDKSLIHRPCVLVGGLLCCCRVTLAGFFRWRGKKTSVWGPASRKHPNEPIPKCIPRSSSPGWSLLRALAPAWDPTSTVCSAVLLPKLPVSLRGSPQNGRAFYLVRKFFPCSHDPKSRFLHLEWPKLLNSPNSGLRFNPPSHPLVLGFLPFIQLLKPLERKTLCPVVIKSLLRTN